MNRHELLDRLEAAEKENTKLREALAQKMTPTGLYAEKLAGIKA